MPRLFQLVFAFLSAGLVVFAPLAQAEAPKVQTQVPGYYRTQLGQFEITALYDGTVELETKLLKNAGASELQRQLARMFVGGPKVQNAVNAYLINTGPHLVLVDTGAARLFGPSLGNVLQNMKASGYDPAQVDTVIITHLHPDHVGGLRDAGGQPLFPNASIFVSQADSDFFLSEKGANAPAEMRPFFKMARDSAAPYLSKGQWKTFTKPDVVVPGIRAVKANGHTPGHTAYVVESEGQKLMIWGDLIHFYAVQFARPSVSVEFDIDQKQAIATRRSIMKGVAAGKYLVAGMHLPFPGIGHIRADGKGSYSWVPIEFGPVSK